MFRSTLAPGSTRSTSRSMVVTWCIRLTPHKRPDRDIASDSTTFGAARLLAEKAFSICSFFAATQVLHPGGGEIHEHPVAAEAVPAEILLEYRLELPQPFASVVVRHHPPQRPHVHVLEIRQHASRR